MIKRTLYYLIILLLFGSTFSCKQSKNKKNDYANDSYVIADSSILDTDTNSKRYDFIKIFSDSINKANQSANLPEFLKNSQFDFQMSGLLSSIHKPISLRNLILKQVTNCNSLGLIINSKNALYRTLPKNDSKIDLEFKEYSFYDLALARFKELKCK